MIEDTIEIDLSNFSKQDLINIIGDMHSLNVTFNQYVVLALEKLIKDKN